jgi:hypothetical protein
LLTRRHLLSAFGINLDLPEFSAIGQALKAGVTVEQLLHGIWEALKEAGVDVGTLGGSIINDYRLGRINEDEFSRRMLDLGLNLLGGAGALKKFGSVANALKYALKKSKKIAKEIVEDVSQGRSPIDLEDVYKVLDNFGCFAAGTKVFIANLPANLTFVMMNKNRSITLELRETPAIHF